MRRRTLLGVAAAALASACAPSLAMFNRLTPHDQGARPAALDVAYGEGARRKLDIYAPAASTEPAPVIVFVYGGSWSSGDKADYEFVGAAFAARGFVTVIPDYRLVPEVRFPDFVDDAAAAVRWVHQNIAAHGGDPARIVLVGHSAGAHITAMLALDRHFLGDVTVRGMAGLAGPYDFLPFDVEATREAFAGTPDPLTTQPVHFARADAPPLFLGWGVNDTLVGRRNIDGLERAVRAAGGHVETKIYPNLDHVGIMLALSRMFRGRGPVLEDVVTFARGVTA